MPTTPTSYVSAADLPAEIYGDIFLHNVRTAQNMQEGLAFSLDYSWVCRSWRSSIIPYELLWSEVLFFDSNEGHTSLPLLETIVARSKKTTLLSIEAGCTTYRSGEYDERRNYLISILRSNWQRVRHLRVAFVGGPLGADQVKEMMVIVCKPAPNLQMFDARLYGDGGIIQLRPHNLFNNVAPSLRRFNARGIHFSFNSPWLSNLTSFTTSRMSQFIATMKETLDTLERMPHLEYLAIGHRIQVPLHDVDELSLPRVISLPALTHLVIEQPIFKCVSLLDNIEPSASGCLTSFSAGLIFHEQAIHLRRLFETSLLRARRIFPIEAFQSICVNFDNDGITISIATPQLEHRTGTSYHTINSLQCVCFRLCWDNLSTGIPIAAPSRDHTAHIPEIELALGYFSNITTLRVAQVPPNTMDLLARFSLVTTLEINIDVLLCIHLLGGGNHEDAPYQLFPQLRTLRVNLLPFRNVYGDGDLIPELISFLRDRALCDVPIHHLDFVGPKSDTEKSVCRRFSEFNDLKVTWKGTRDPEDNDLHYIYRLFLFIWGLILANIPK